MKKVSNKQIMQKTTMVSGMVDSMKERIYLYADQLSREIDWRNGEREVKRGFVKNQIRLIRAELMELSNMLDKSK